MHKIIIGSSVSAIVAFFLIAPLWTGYHSEQELLELTNGAPLPNGTKLRIDSYNRGWFSSTGELKVIVNSGQPAPITVAAPFKVFHGPIIIGKDVGFKIAPAAVEVIFKMPNVDEATQKQLANVIDENALITIISTIGLTGNLHATVHTTGINYKETDGMMSWSGLQGTVDYLPSHKTVKSHITVSPVELSVINPDTAPKQLEISEIVINSNLHQDDNGLWLGDVSSDIKTIKHQEGEKTTLLEDFHHTSNLQNNGDNATINYHSVLNLQKATVGQHVLGPIDLDYNVNKLDPKGVVDFNNDLRNLLFSDDSSLAGNSIRLLQSAAFMIHHGLEVDVNKLDIKASKGEFHLTAKVNLPAITNLLAIISNADQLLKEVQITVNMKTSELLAKQLMQVASYHSLERVSNIDTAASPEQKQTINDLIAKEDEQTIQNWLNAGYVALENGQYVTTLEIKEGVAFANGKRIEEEEPAAAPAQTPVPAQAPAAAIPAPQASAAK